MRRKQVILRLAVVLLLSLPIALWSVGKATGNDETVRGKQAPELKLQIQQIISAQDAAMTEINNRYSTAPLADRVAIEAEGARIRADYERQYFSVLVEYHRLTGNRLEMEKAQRNLEAITLAPVANKQPDSDVQKQTNTNSGTEGVIVNEQN